MKRVAAALLAFSVILLAVTGSAASPSVEVNRNIASMPLAFTENQGQWDERVLFRANAGAATMWFSQDGAYYQFTRRVARDDEVSDDPLHPGLDRFDRELDSIETMMIKASFVGANPNPQIAGIDAMEYKCNYFIGNEPDKWRTDVHNYEAIIYEDIYDGIDLKYYGNGRQMEYDFIVSPGADPEQIRIEYKGAISLSVNDVGELVVETDWGNVTELKPHVYQLNAGQRMEIECEYMLLSGSEFGFNLRDGYDSRLPLVVDPVLSYSTYLGGNNSDNAKGIAVDDNGNAFVTGNTQSLNFPTENPYQTEHGSGFYDAFVTKLNSSGNGLIYSTYLGGSSVDMGFGIAVDDSGNVLVTGYTRSSDFPTENPYQTDQGDEGDNDAFVTKLNSSGNSLIYSTYLGGSGGDYGSGIAVDDNGSAFVTGGTASSDFPTENPYQAHQGGEDAFVVKLNSSGNSLIYSTYLGGSGGDIGMGIAVDDGGSSYVTGFTWSVDFPTENPYQAHQEGEDAFVAKLNSSGNGLVYSTYLGGNATDRGSGIALDNSGSSFVTGYTYSSDFPTENPYQTNQSEGDVFVAKLNSLGNGLVYSTYLGGSGGDYGSGIAVDDNGSAFVTGYTISTDFPTEDPYQTDHGGGFYDVFVTRLNSSGNGLIYSTYLGGGHDDYGSGIAADENGNAFVTGNTVSSNFPTAHPYQTNQGGTDAFVTKLSSAASCCMPPIRGNVDYDPGDVIDISDLVYLVDFMFNGGPDPVCIDEADVDGSGEIDISDLVHIVDYMFNDGPPPVACP